MMHTLGNLEILLDSDECSVGKTKLNVEKLYILLLDTVSYLANVF